MHIKSGASKTIMTTCSRTRSPAVTKIAVTKL